MKEGRNNTILLTVIGIATLLVAVVGATFAYFSAQSKYEDQNSTLEITAGSGGSMKFESGLIDLKNIYPREAAWATKGFVITNTSESATDADIKYKLSLVSSTDFSSDALTYEFAEAGTDGVCINPKIENNEITGCNDAELAKSTLAVIAIVVVIVVIVFCLDFVFESMNKYGVDKLKNTVQTAEDNTKT